MADIQADFTLEQQPTINVELTLGEQSTIDAELQLDVINTNHNALEGRDLPDQHPISAISSLQDILNKLWTFTYEQGVASDTWEITHNLGRKPSVVIVDSADNVFYPAVQYINDNKLVVTMNGATTGKAYLN